MPILVIAVIMFALFLVMGLLATVAVLAALPLQNKLRLAEVPPLSLP